MYVCDTYVCSGHLGKFPDCSTEQAWHYAQEVGTWSGESQYGLAWSLFHLSEPDPEFPALRTGWHLIVEDDTGFTDLLVGEQAVADAQLLEERYEEWAGVV